MTFHKRIFRDANHLSICSDLKKKLKWSVCDLSMVGNAVPDIIVANDVGTTALIEIKVPGTGRFYLSQLRFLATWKGLAGFAATTQDVINILDHPDEFGLTSRQRCVILDIVAEDLAQNTKRGTASLGKEQITVKKFEALFAEKMKDVVPAWQCSLCKHPKHGTGYCEIVGCDCLLIK